LRQTLSPTDARIRGRPRRAVKATMEPRSFAVVVDAPYHFLREL
jgi:hypothetical protein